MQAVQKVSLSLIRYTQHSLKFVNYRPALRAYSQGQEGLSLTQEKHPDLPEQIMTYPLMSLAIDYVPLAHGIKCV